MSHPSCCVHHPAPPRRESCCVQSSITHPEYLISTRSSHCGHTQYPTIRPGVSVTPVTPPLQGCQSDPSRPAVPVTPSLQGCQSTPRSPPARVSVDPPGHPNQLFQLCQTTLFAPFWPGQSRAVAPVAKRPSGPKVRLGTSREVW